MGRVNPSTAAARVLVDELVRCGVTEAVLCPGSRSAPLAYALAATDADPAVPLRLHVRTDERTAGFLALGLAVASGRVVPVVTTSGTAVANLHPAVLEAHHQGVPLLALTADRPPELRGTGANQTTHQPGLLRDVRLAVDLGTPGATAGTAGVAGVDGAVDPAQVASWRTAVDRCVSAATGALGGAAGPVHLNVPFRDPLMPPVEVATHQVTDAPAADVMAGRPDGAPWTAVDGAGDVSPEQVQEGTHVALLPDGPERTLVLLGDLGRPELARAVQAGARARGWPVVAEPFGRFGVDGAVPFGIRVLDDEGFLADHAPERVLVVGRLTLHRSVGRLVRRDGVVVESVTAGTTWPDPGHRVQRVHPLVLGEPGDGASRVGLSGTAAEGSDGAWATTWWAAGEAAGALAAGGPVRSDDAVGGAGAASGLTTASAAAVVAEATQGLLFLGSSRAPRSMDLWTPGPGPGVTGVVGNRGLAGIDGCLSTAAGWALTQGPTTALVGDLTFLHDANALAVGPGEPRPDLTVVVLSDDGGAIFSDLEYGRAPWREAHGEDTFRRVFTTPTGVDVSALAAAYGVPVQRATSVDGLRAAVSDRPRGLRVVEAVLQG